MPPETIPALPPGSPWWAQLVVTILCVFVMPYLLKFLRAKTEESKKGAELAVIDANKSLIEQRGAIAERLKSYLWGTAAAIAEREFPKLCAAIIAGKFKDPQDIKAQLRSWGFDLRFQAIEYFNTQGVDLLQTFGEQAIDDLIERAANAVSPFPGKDTAIALLRDGAAPLLVERGVEWMRNATAKPIVPAPIADAS